MAYLAESEITIYCTNIPGITMDIIETASSLIDAYKGRSFLSKEYTEQSKLTKKRGQYGDVYRGKLKHLPRTDVTSVLSYTLGIFGDEQNTTYDALTSLRFDEDDSLYFQFFPQKSLTNPFGVAVPTQITVVYSAGYTTATIPDILKRVTGLLAENIKKNGGLLRWTDRSDFDMKMSLADDALFPRELKAMVNMVVLT